MRVAVAALGAAMVLWASAASAQGKPDFSGKWTVDQEKTQAANPGQPGGGGPPGGGGGRMGMGAGPMTITMDAATLTQEREGPNGAIKTVYKLDGTEQTISMGQREAKAKAAWDGTNLVITTVREGQNGVMTTKASWAKDGDWLVVTTTMQTPNGEMVRKTYYKKG